VVPKNSLPFVSVVIPHRGGDTALERCLLALRAQDYPTSLYEVLVVLNEPDLRALDLKLKKNEVALWEPAYFSYAARNAGVSASRGDIIAFTDSDTLPHDNWLREGVREIQDSDADLVAGDITVTTHSPRFSPSALYEMLYAFDQRSNVAGGYSATANLFATRAVLTQQALFEETALTGEDFEWTRAAVSHGAKLVHAPRAVVEHPARETWSALLAKARRTTIPYAGVSTQDSSEVMGLKARLIFQLQRKPNPATRAELSVFQRLVAHTVRGTLIGYKALCLIGLSPRFRAELQSYRQTLAHSAQHQQEVML